MTQIAVAWRGLLPARDDYRELPHTWRKDLLAGITVGVVALPLALGFGVTSGMGASAGIVTAIVAGLVAAILGGSDVQVSGPTGAMTVVLVPLAARYGVAAVPVVGIMAGIMVAFAGLMRLGRILSYLPWSVVEGFTLGIAAIIGLQQIPAALGVAKPAGENTAVVAARAIVAAAQGAISWHSVALVALVMAVMAVLRWLRPTFPGSLLAVIIATLVSWGLGFDVATIGALPQALPQLRIPSVEWGMLQTYVAPAVAVAALAGIESLLSAKVADAMTHERPHNPDRELWGQGLATIAACLCGGMPATGAIARTAVNVRSGGRTRLSAIVHAVALILVVLVGSALVSKIPVSALAGVLLMTSICMVDRANLSVVTHTTRSDAVVLVLTALATVAFDLIVAVELGVFIAGILALRHVARTSSVTAAPLVLDLADQSEAAFIKERVAKYRIDGALFFGTAQRFLDEFSQISGVTVVILQLNNLRVLDATGAQTLGEIVRTLGERQVTVMIEGARGEHEAALAQIPDFAEVFEQGHIFITQQAAIAHTRLHIHNIEHPRRHRAPANSQETPQF
ncbi:MAG: SulP family inorganic anion transporter [Propionibacteriaceae bacterium]